MKWNTPNKIMSRFKTQIEIAKKKVVETTETMFELLRRNKESTIEALNETLRVFQQENQDDQTDIQTAIQRIDEFVGKEEEVTHRNIAPEVLESCEFVEKRCKTLLAEPQSILATKPRPRNMTVHYVPNKQVIQSFPGTMGTIVKRAIDPTRSSMPESLKQGRVWFCQSVQHHHQGFNGRSVLHQGRGWSTSTS